MFVLPTCSYMANSLAATVVKSSATDARALELVVGIADGASFASSNPTWLQPPAAQDRCYVGAQPGLSHGSAALVHGQIAA
jgi:hypothetical protein